MGVMASPINAPTLSPRNPPSVPPTSGAKGPSTGVSSAVRATVPMVAPTPPPTAFCILSPAASLDPNDTTPDRTPAPPGELSIRPALPRKVVPLNEFRPATLPLNRLRAASLPNLRWYLCLAALLALDALWSLLPRIARRCASLCLCCSRSNFSRTFFSLGLRLNNLASRAASPNNFHGCRRRLVKNKPARPPTTFSAPTNGPFSVSPSKIILKLPMAMFQTFPRYVLSIGKVFLRKFSFFGSPIHLRIPKMAAFNKRFLNGSNNPSKNDVPLPFLSRSAFSAPFCTVLLSTNDSLFLSLKNACSLLRSATVSF